MQILKVINPPPHVGTEQVHSPGSTRRFWPNAMKLLARKNAPMCGAFLSMIFAVLLVPSMATAQVPQGIFQDDFSDNNAAGWTFVGVNSSPLLWDASTGKLQSATTQTNYIGSPGFALIDGVTTPDHFSLEADVQVVGPVPGRGADFGHVGFVWGYQDFSNFNINYLRTHSNHVTSWSRIALSERILGLPFNAVNAPDLSGVSYHLKIEVNYSTREMTVSLDNETITFTGSNFDAVNRSTSGGIGMITWGERVSYDNVVLIQNPGSNPDTDGDGVPDDQDICPGGDDNLDGDSDGAPDFCDACPADANNDSDGDGSCDSVDLCLGNDASGDSDLDGLCDDTDPCTGSSNSDVDGDGVCDEGDLCLGDDATGNADGDGVCDDLDACEGDDATGDTDGDLFCNDLDACPLDVENDFDNDGVCESDDNCPLIPNDNQSDLDGDMVGDACDDDIDGDGDLNDADNCVYDFNPYQEDFDNDGEGDACDADIDADGVEDAVDACLPTPLGEVVNGGGCSIAELCPCENDWKNHGAYVRCVAHTSEDFVDAGLISETEKGTIVSTAGQSECGHKN